MLSKFRHFEHCTVAYEVITFISMNGGAVPLVRESCSMTNGPLASNVCDDMLTPGQAPKKRRVYSQLHF